ncbi:hypothetical protein [Heyndrickxia oleronia]|jgi:hypothetical protein|uniref:hypothetical protein n=1 Tax=Heyndrickxia oleronia TaxID=38875 RepID=UPI0024327D99|nr:hypothetical protein [Heyndrickxia oleronia]MCI1763642.1 hypothetical protein [Heyndrickxia oleronia]
MSKKIKVINPNVFDIGINFMDGIKSTVIPPKGYRSIPEEEIDFINSTSNMFRRKMLIIDDVEKNKEFGFEVRTVANYSDDEIRDLIKGHLNKIKSTLVDEKEKHVVDRVIGLAREFEDLNLNKVKYLEEWSGYQFRLLEDK